MKKGFKFLVSILLIAFCLVPLFACSKKPKVGEVEKIEIIQGSFKSYYELDENVDFSKAKIRVFFKTGSSDIVQITKSMVSGLDTRTNLPAKKMLTVEYEGCIDKFEYGVGGAAGVTSAARIKIVLTQTAENKDVIQVFLANTSYVDTGIYALSFVVTKSGDLGFKKSWTAAQKYKDSPWITSTEEIEENKEIQVVFCSETGIDKIQSPQDILLYEMEIEKSLEEMHFGIKEITLSDGKKDTKAPSSAISILPDDF